MISKIKIALSAAVVLSAAFPALAATKHHRITHTPPAINVDRGSGLCSPIHPPFCSNICTGSGPCAPPDSW